MYYVNALSLMCVRACDTFITALSNVYSLFPSILFYLKLAGISHILIQLEKTLCIMQNDSYEKCNFRNLLIVDVIR